MESKIRQIVESNPLLSNREIGKMVGLCRSSVQYYMNKLNIHRDRKLMQKANNTCREKSLTITPNAEQIILGSILGDGYMSPNRHPEDTHLTLNSELRITHGIKQKEYVEFKKILLEKEGIRCHLKFLDNLPTHYLNDVEVKENGSYHLKTQRNISFNFYRDLFYRPNKTINRYMYRLNPLGLAIWFMDDGFKNGRGFTFATDSFSLKEVQLLQKILKRKFGLNTTINLYRHCKPRLYIRTSSRQQFIELISPYVCKSMKYKLEL